MSDHVSTADLLARRMSFLSARQGVISGNIANANTPGYLARDLQAAPAGESKSFAMAMTQAGHIRARPSASSEGRMVEDATSIEHNGNSVRLDEQMLKMSSVQGEYRLMTELYAKSAALQKMAVSK